MSDNLPPGYYPSYAILQLEVCKLVATLNLTADLIPDPNETTALGTILQNNGINIALSLDGVACAVADRVLVCNQTSAEQNGIYIVRDVGGINTPWQLVRAPDFYWSALLVSGYYVNICDGLTKKGKFYTLVNPLPATINTDPIIFLPS